MHNFRAGQFNFEHILGYRAAREKAQHFHGEPADVIGFMVNPVHANSEAILGPAGLMARGSGLGSASHW